MKTKKTVRFLIIISCLCLLVFTLSSCALFSNEMKNIKGELIGNNFTIDFYDHFGSNKLTLNGQKVGLEANYVNTETISSDGSSGTIYEMSSVITMTIDGNQVALTGDTVVFAEEGLEKLHDFELPANITTDGGTLNILDRNINDIKNVIGTPKVVVVCSQLGVPIAAYGGKSVYWEIPDDLPKTTKLNIDGKALYIHRANYILLDTEMIK